ncbi:MAG: BolA/IbaG family iron-sulfur metabolism protein [Gammaproteobacteria bacterium]|nr:BolA/IbaG family iron-sulfur metabolism protein [Gammaproteobacteria bacterium]
MSIQQTIEQKLEAAFTPEFLAVENETHMHNVPPDAESHFKVTVVTNEFKDLILIKRHRLVNKVLDNEIKQIHALALHTMTSDEWFEKAGKVVASPPCEGGGK